MEEYKICCFTGHRPQKLPFGFNEADEGCIMLKKRLKDEIIKQITQNDVRRFISGMALGIDTYAAEIVLALKREYPDITLECAIPCEAQAEKWSDADCNRYFNILDSCDKKTMVQREYTRDCMLKRDRYMVDCSDVVIAVYGDEKKGGTRYTVQYAQKKGRQIIFINPDELN